MPVKKTNEAIENEPIIQEITFPTDALINSGLFKNFNRNFLKALLPKATYTKKEAETIVNSYFKGGK